MYERLEEMLARFEEIEGLLADPSVASEPGRYKLLAREHGSLRRIVPLYCEMKKVASDREEAEAVIADGSDEELAELAREELDGLKAREAELFEDLKRRLVTADEDSDKDAIIEIRAGTGGDEACLFAGDLHRMYQRYAERMRWKTELMSGHTAAIGGVKEVVFSVSGKEVFGLLRFESGVHRVQRVPETEAQGRIHTSAATVAVLPEVEDVEIEIKQEDLQWETFRSSGPGGQNVNKIESAVRVTHTPTGIVVSCQDDKSQHKNRAQAMRVLRSRIYAAKQEEQAAERREMRRSQVGTGDRSDKIRTYNFPQNRVTDHRIGYTTHNLDGVMDGDLDDLIAHLRASAEEEAMKEAGLG